MATTGIAVEREAPDTIRVLCAGMLLKHVAQDAGPKVQRTRESQVLLGPAGSLWWKREGRNVTGKSQKAGPMLGPSTAEHANDAVQWRRGGERRLDRVRPLRPRRPG
jgi:hypothetical protein